MVVGLLTYRETIQLGNNKEQAFHLFNKIYAFLIHLLPSEVLAVNSYKPEGPETVG